VNAILDTIYATKEVTDGVQSFSALNAQGLPTYMDRDEGALLQRVIQRVRPHATLEVGMAYGVSTLFICEALAALDQPVRHVAIDPFQRSRWHGVGLHNVERAGFGSLVDLIEERSEFCLPRLLAQNARIQFALIDGLHTFEQCALEFYYIDRLLDVGGAIAFDDADWRGINRVIRLALSGGTYEVFERTGADRRVSLLGRARRFVARIPGSRSIVRRDVLDRDWDLGIAASCVALHKVRESERANGFWRDF
jgi:predicted O-methyltransferase YrrM